MHKRIAVGALALAMPLATSVPAAAQDPETADLETIEVRHQLLTPAAGLMNDHMHEGGEVMIGLRLERSRFSGPNLSGSDTISDTAILAAGYTTRAQAMEMEMVMLDLMAAPTDELTLMVMPHYMWHRMTMVGIYPAHTGEGHGGEHGHHGSVPFGERHEHATKGLGDTLVSASYRLARGPGLRAHATLGVWVPTGAVDRKDADGNYVHYGMQPGSGTWDLEPSVTASGGSGALGWGGQASYRWRGEKANASGFAFGDKARATGWLSYLLTGDLGATARLEFEHEGAIEGHYNSGHNHAAPPDRQENYGGETWTAGLGLNWLLPTGGARRPQLGVEMALPVHQDLNGIQVPRAWRTALSLAQAF